MDPPYQEFAPLQVLLRYKSLCPTARTFLNGKIHIGLENRRVTIGDPAVLPWLIVCASSVRDGTLKTEHRRESTATVSIILDYKSSGVTSRAR